jgi:hypothetical protein
LAGGGVDVHLDVVLPADAEMVLQHGHRIEITRSLEGRVELLHGPATRSIR